MRIYDTNGIRKEKQNTTRTRPRKKQNIITHAQHADQFLMKTKKSTAIEQIDQHAKPNGKRNMEN